MRWIRFSTKEAFGFSLRRKWLATLTSDPADYPSSKKVTDLQLEELAQLIGQSSQVVVVEHQFPQIAELPNLGGQGPQLVVGQV